MKIRHIAIALLLVPLFSFAQTDTPPRAGLTPQSPFYFLDRLGETLQALLAFSPEAKIRVQMSFAAERIAEIQIDMEAKDVDAKGLAVAQERLQSHLSKASVVLVEEKKKGKNVSEWEKMIKGKFEDSKKTIESSFEVAKDTLEDERELVKEELEVAKKGNDVALVESLRQKLSDLEEEKDLLEDEREKQKQSLEDEREKFSGEDDEDEDDIDDTELNEIEDDLEEIEIEVD